MILVTKLGLLVNTTSSRAGITSCRLFVNLRQTEVSCLVKYGLVLLGTGYRWFHLIPNLCLVDWGHPQSKQCVAGTCMPCLGPWQFYLFRCSGGGRTVWWTDGKVGIFACGFDSNKDCFCIWVCWKLVGNMTFLGLTIPSILCVCVKRPRTDFRVCNVWT